MSRNYSVSVSGSGNHGSVESKSRIDHNIIISHAASLWDRIILTDSLFEELKCFLSYDGINNLLNASRKYQSVKKVWYYWKMNKKYSMICYLYDAFRLKVDLLLIDGKKQLS
jgi:hypothetical protein